MQYKLYMLKGYNLIIFDTLYETITTIKIINMSITPQNFLVPFLILLSHPIPSPPPVPEQLLICFLLLQDQFAFSRIFCKWIQTVHFLFLLQFSLNITILRFIHVSVFHLFLVLSSVPQGGYTLPLERHLGLHFRANKCYEHLWYKFLYGHLFTFLMGKQEWNGWIMLQIYV